MMRSDWTEVSDLFTLRQREPCKELIACILHRAILDTFSTELGIQKEALEWCYSNSALPWSLAWCLEQLDYTEAIERFRRYLSTARIEAIARTDRVFGDGYFEQRRNGQRQRQRKTRRTRACVLPSGTRVYCTQDAAILRELGGRG